jgi:hypothetical protein
MPIIPDRFSIPKKMVSQAFEPFWARPPKYDQGLKSFYGQILSSCLP